MITQPVEGVFRLSAGDDIRDFHDEAEAIAVGEARIREMVAAHAKEAGTDAAEIEVTRDLKTSVIEGQRMFIEAHLVAVASGRPRIAA
jgi:hypothetical protein